MWVSIGLILFLCLHDLCGELNARVPDLIMACQDRPRDTTPIGHLDSRTFGANAWSP